MRTVTVDMDAEETTRRRPAWEGLMECAHCGEEFHEGCMRKCPACEKLTCCTDRMDGWCKRCAAARQWAEDTTIEDLVRRLIGLTKGDFDA